MNSTYQTLNRAFQLQTVITVFQNNRSPKSTDRDPTYSPSEDQIQTKNWNEVRRYSKLLRPFVQLYTSKAKLRRKAWRLLVE